VELRKSVELMKAIQKLEIGFSLATFVASHAYLGFTSLRSIDWDDPVAELIMTFLLITFPGLLLIVGAYSHASTQSLSGLIALLSGGSILIVIFGLSSIVLLYGIVPITLLPPASVIFAALTIIFAFCSRKSFAIGN
jgi:hypothetical protein